MPIYLVFSRLHIYLRHRFGSKQGLFGHGERRGRDDGGDCADGRAGDGQLALLTFDRPGASLHGRVPCVLRSGRDHLCRVLRRHASSGQDDVGRGDPPRVVISPALAQQTVICLS